MMPVALAAAICHRFQWGTPAAPPCSVQGGLLHRMYRIETEQGRLAVKVLDPGIMQKPNIRDEFRRSERIAALFADAGLPAVTALAIGGDTVQTIGEATVMGFPWVDGKMLSPHAATAEQAAQIGAMLGRMHALDLQVPELPLAEFHTYPEAHWERLVQQAAAEGMEWAQAPAALLTELLDWNRLARQGYGTVGNRWAVSHGDLDQKNVLWQDEHTPRLIDWESAGLVNPALEVIGAALSWSGQMVAPPEHAVFAALLAGYRRYADLPAEMGRAALQGCIGNWLHWLEPNMKRSLPSSGADADGRQAGLGEVNQTLTLLRALAAHREAWAGWC